MSKKPLCACKVTKFLVKDKLGLLKELLATVVKPEPEAPKKKKKKRRRRRRR